MTLRGPIAALLFLCSASATAAQEVRIEVRTDLGRPLPAAGAFVFFGPDSVVTMTLNPRGDLVLDPARIAGFRRIVIRHLGFRSAFLFPEDVGTVESVEMVEDVITIEGLTASVDGQRCPATSDPGAVEVVRRVASGYVQPAGNSMSAVQRSANDTRSRAFLFESPPRPREYNPNSNVLWIEGPDPRADLRRPVSIDRWIDTHGVVTSNDHPLIRRFLNWTYPRFDGPDAVFFASPLFVEESDFRFLNDDEARIRFCFAGDALQGVITLENDRVTEISWRFHTDDPDEEAGGLAVFETDPLASPHLLPTEGLFYRLATPRNPELFYREASWYEHWRIEEHR